MASEQSRQIKSRPKLDYYSVELTPLTDGTVFVSITLSRVRTEGEFDTTVVDEDIVNTMTDAFKFIHDGIHANV